MNKLVLNNAKKHCNENIYKLGSDFYYSCIFLNENEKSAVASILSFYKKVSSIPDNNKDKDINLVKINWWKKEINNMYGGKPSHPISISLKFAVDNFAIEKKIFLNIIKGVYLNLQKKNYENFSDLKKFFYYSYISVSFAIMKVIKVEKKSYIAFYKNISISMQIINIIKNLGRDIRKKKLYLPKSFVNPYKIDLNKLLDLKNSKNLSIILRKLGFYANYYYKKAMPNIKKTEKKNRSILIISDIYMSLLKIIQDDSFNVLNQKISITPIKKFFILYKYK